MGKSECFPDGRERSRAVKKKRDHCSTQAFPLAIPWTSKRLLHPCFSRSNKLQQRAPERTSRRKGRNGWGGGRDAPRVVRIKCSPRTTPSSHSWHVSPLLTALPGWENYCYTKTISMPLYCLVEINCPGPILPSAASPVDLGTAFQALHLHFHRQERSLVWNTPSNWHNL